jgi:hypothetical protein
MAKKSKKSERIIKTHMNFFVINEEDKVDKILVPCSMAQSYIDTFGLLTVRTKEEVENWLNQKS